MAEIDSKTGLPTGLKNLKFSAGRGPAVDFAAVRKAGGVISTRSCQIRGELALDPDRKGEKSELMLTHLAAETVLDERAVSVRKNGRFDLKVHFMRGRNTLILQLPSGGEPVIELDLFHRSVMREWVESILKALVLVLIVKTFVIQAFFIPTPSMENTLLRQDYILVEKISYLFRKPTRGEIIVFEYPEDPSKDFIKRLVGTADDVLEIRDREFYHNGKRLDEPYIRHETYPFPESDHRVNFDATRISEDHYFVMGDNRDNSKDSREWGEFPQWRLIGKAWGVYFPIPRLGLIRHGLGAPVDESPSS